MRDPDPNAEKPTDDFSRVARNDRASACIEPNMFSGRGTICGCNDLESQQKALLFLLCGATTTTSAVSCDNKNKTNKQEEEEYSFSPMH